MAKRKAFEPEKTRTIALIGHRSAGKTSLGEVMLRVAGVTRATGSVDRRTALLDHSEEERRRGQSLQLGYAWLEWEDHQVNLVDTPGGDAVAHERTLALCGVDGAVLVVDATAGVQVGTERALDEVVDRELPWMVVLNKADRPSRMEAVLEALQAALPEAPPLVPLQLPFLEEGRFTGILSVLDGRVYRYDDACGTSYSPEPVPERYRGAVQAALERLTEQVALTDDALLEHYLEYLELPRDVLLEGLAQAVRRRKLVPVTLSAATRGIGAQMVLQHVVDLFPSPLQREVVATDGDGGPQVLDAQAPFVAQVLSAHLDDEGGLYRVLRIWSGRPPRGSWVRVRPEGAKPVGKVSKLYQVRGPRRAAARTVGPGALLATWDALDVRPGDTLTDGAPLRMPPPALPPSMMTYLVQADSTRRARQALHQAAIELQARDAALDVQVHEAGQGPPGEPPASLRIAGIGEAHLQLALERLRLRENSLRAELPPVDYRETPAGAVANVEGVHLVEDRHGLVHEFGHCTVDVSPGPPEHGVSFLDTLPPDDIDELPAKYRPAIDEGVRRASAHGPTAGYPVVGLQVTLRGGAYDILQSTDEHFRRAGEKALRAALRRAGTRLLEPWCKVEIDVPQASVGDLISDISSHRGRVLGLDTLEGRGAEVRIQAVCPHRELRTFASRLQAVTQGRGRFVASPSHYEPLPSHLEREAIASSPYRDRAAQLIEEQV